ncbi:MAG: winged helix-turn-helix transcriptional regulator [Candidatus Melainabacteria bacterium]|nr:winged helix-turn-helix transcriptional regulator [Candidatus Melainabacteria bacterium]MBI3308735.1 winged helix-turn-helix transcriptional regulator [Candidatus Melainabacteria bacterium]
MTTIKTKKEIPDEQLLSVTNLFNVLSHPLRIKILWLLKSKKSMSVHELQSLLKISQSNTSQHLSILRKSKLIRENRKGKEVYYKLYESKKLSKLIASAMHLIAYQLSTSTELLSGYTEILSFWV